jgi:septal ring factor EnvC (AmiA/AmiB activator)
MLNWRPVHGIEERTKRIEKDIALIEKDIEQIAKETEQLRRENARERALSALIKQHCFAPECSSIPLPPTDPDCGPSSP